MTTVIYRDNKDNIDLPVLQKGALEEAYGQFIPWHQDVTNAASHCRLYLAPDEKTYILEPKTKIWPELIGKTIAFIGYQPGNEWESGRVFKYIVVQEDVGKCASDMDFNEGHDDHGDDFISRRDYPPSSSEG